MTTQQTTTSTETTTPAAGTDQSTETTTTEGGGGGGATETQGTDATQPTAAADEWANFDAERAKQTILNQRKAEAELKRANAALEAKNKEYEREKLTEQERIVADLEAAKAEAETARKAVADMREQRAFDAAALAAGIPPNALTAARAVAGKVASSDESGNVTIDTAVFDRLKAEHGYLFGQQAAPPPPVSFGAASGQGSGGKGDALTPDEIAMAQRAGMSTEDWAKYRQRTQH